MSSGILLRRELSIAYFVASIFFLLILRAMYFATDFAHKQLLQCLAYFAFVLGILLVFGGIIVLVLELLNTATEAVVDLAIGRQFHPLARIAKDCAAAAVLVAALSSMMIALLLLIPPLLQRLGL